MEKLKDLYVNRMLSLLEAQGKKIIAEAKATKETKNDTFNQYDAFGYLVYFNGDLKRWSSFPPKAEKPHKGWEKHDIPAATGSAWAEMFKDEFKPPKKGFSLVVFNAAFYSRIQEEGTASVKYKILSQVVGSMKGITEQFKGATLTGINIDVT